MWRKKGADIPLEDGAKVAVIGGGPAGCFFALYLLRYAHRKRITLHVSIFDGRDFKRAGPPGCAS